MDLQKDTQHSYWNIACVKVFDCVKKHQEALTKHGGEFNADNWPKNTMISEPFWSHKCSNSSWKHANEDELNDQVAYIVFSKGLGSYKN